ncbi:MAG: AbrB/MazE/SpoVT family DNA-binding domain-containing protein [Gammaproteobacteria bacterium]|nr:AbrB/MazE/SpoVT family DNA-binding domain-containing protein [Gammaproteobacteria bacterium]
MQSTITSCGQTVIPASVRRHLGLTPATRLEWIVEDGQIRVIPGDKTWQVFRAAGCQTARSAECRVPCGAPNVGFRAERRMSGSARSAGTRKNRSPGCLPEDPGRHPLESK